MGGRTLALAAALAWFSLPAVAQQQAASRTEQTVLAPISGWGATNPRFDELGRNLRGAQNPFDLGGRISAETPSGAKLIEFPLTDGTLFETLSVPKAQLDRLTGIVTRKVEQGARGQGSALPELRDAFRSSPAPTLQGLGVYATGSASDFSLVPATAEMRRVNETFVLALERAGAKGMAVSLEQLEVLSPSQQMTRLGQRWSSLAPVASQYARTMGALQTALRQPEPSNRQAYVDAARATRQSFIDNWPNLRGNPEARRAAVRALDGLARQSELKTVYGEVSSFRPVSYQEVYQQSSRAVALLQNGVPICSGVALDNTWVMTAGHCFMNRAWQGVSVAFAGPGGAIGAGRPIRQQWPTPAPGSRGGDAIDYVFVRVDPPAGDPPAAPCLRSAEAVHEDPVVVIGYAGQQGLVYDHAYVLYPHLLRPTELGIVEAMAGARLQRLAEAFYPPDRYPDALRVQEAFIQDNLRSFDAAYSTRIGSDADAPREYRAGGGDVSAGRPRFGFDTDTVSGNSGSAVYLRPSERAMAPFDKVCIVGVLAGGRGDNVRVSEATWMEHEYGTPLSAILADERGRDVGALSATDRQAVEALRLILAGAISP